METVVATILKLQPSHACITDPSEKQYFGDVLRKTWGLPSSFKHFPGANPVSIERSKLQTLVERDYIASLKTDGVRYVLLMTTKPNSVEPISLMINRAMEMFEVEIWANEEYFFHNSLFDGELVWNSNNHLMYVVFDVIRVKGEPCVDMTYRERLHVVQNSILQTDSNVEDSILESMVSEEDKLCARNNLYQLHITTKIYVSLPQLSELWKNRLSCSHRNDGLVFTLNDCTVQTGTSEEMFKWKPFHSIDVRCLLDNSGWKIYANSNTSSEEVEMTTSLHHYTIDFTYSSKLMQMLERKRNCVVECLVTVKNNAVTLIPERERSDKKSANTVKTILGTIRNAQENIEIDELLNLQFS